MGALRTAVVVRFVGVAVFSLLVSLAAAEAQEQACCVEGACLLATAGHCADQSGVPVDQQSCDGVICVQCCDHFGDDENVCADHLPLGSCKNSGVNTIVVGGSCSAGSGNIGVCLQSTEAPTLSPATLMGLAAALIAAGWVSVRKRSR